MGNILYCVKIEREKKSHPYCLLVTETEKIDHTHPETAGGSEVAVQEKESAAAGAQRKEKSAVAAENARAGGTGEIGVTEKGTGENVIALKKKVRVLVFVVLFLVWRVI